jgi:hypothetical protein
MGLALGLMLKNVFGHGTKNFFGKPFCVKKTLGKGQLKKKKLKYFLIFTMCGLPLG